MIALETDNPMFGITRVPRGWRLRLMDRTDEGYQEFFSDSAYGGHEHSLAAVKRVRDEIISTEEFKRWKADNPLRRFNTTGFRGLGCTVESDMVVRMNRVGRFLIQVPGKQRLTKSFIGPGVWETYQEMVGVLHELTNEPCPSLRRMMRAYDEVFIPNWRARLDAIGVNWRRGQRNARRQS